MIWVDPTERIFTETDRERRTLEWPWFARIARCRAAAPDVARALAEGDEHAHRGDGIEHCERIALRLVERVHLLFGARVDREARRGRGEPILVLRHGVVERRPDEDLQLCEMLLDDAQYAFILPCGLDVCVYTYKCACQVSKPDNVNKNVPWVAGSIRT